MEPIEPVEPIEPIDAMIRDALRVRAEEIRAERSEDVWRLAWAMPQPWRAEKVRQILAQYFEVTLPRAERAEALRLAWIAATYKPTTENVAEVMRLYDEVPEVGICTACGEDAYCVPPHDDGRCCEHCGRFAVIGADVIAALEDE